MIGSFYHERDSLLHRLPAGPKLLFVMVLGTMVFLFNDIRVAAAVCGGVVLLYAVARVPVAVAWQQMRFAVPLLVIIFAAQWFIADWRIGAIVVLRFAALILAASLVTLTTRTTAMIDAFERFLKPAARIGVNVRMVSMSLSLALRFIPVVGRVTQQVREAQRARGLENSILAVALPVIVRMLKMSDDIADAIEARSFSSEDVHAEDGQARV